MSTFVDSSALLAMLDEEDRFHDSAMVVWQGLLRDEEDLVTTNYVLLETTSIAQRRWGMEAVAELSSAILPALGVHWVAESEHSQAMSTLLAARRRELSLVDCVSFETMRHLRLTRCFGFDPHFAEVGFTCVPERQ